MTKTIAIIVAAGKGTRLSAELPKQYLNLGQKSIISTTLDVFLSHQAIDEIICIINPDHETLFLQTIGDKRQQQIKWTYGGDTRQQSVLNGLLEAESLNPDFVLIHDAARPFVTDKIIDDIKTGLPASDSTLPAFAIADSLKRQTEVGMENIERHLLYSAQTPQGFVFKKISEAHKKAAAANIFDFTDDTALAEWAGMSVSYVEGAKRNFKITTTEDYEMACALSAPKTSVRLGHGYDVHAFDKGDCVILCGVKIPHDKKLKGHSDADVALHALTDAIYGSIGAGDIGHHFPPSEEKWKNAASHIFLEHAVSTLAKKGGTIINLDVTLVCEAPKIGPHRDKMRQFISEITGLDISQISVKATTSEGLGFTGRGEGIASFATALVQLAGVE